MPGILERLDLRVAVRAFGRFEQHVVIGVRIERRVEIDQINAAIRDMFAQDVEIVPEIERAGHAANTGARAVKGKRAMQVRWGLRDCPLPLRERVGRSEENTYERQSLM